MKELKIQQYESNFMSSSSPDMKDYLTDNNSHEYKVFVSTYRVFPNIIDEDDIQVSSFLEAFLKEFSELIKDVLYTQRSVEGSATSQLDDAFFFFDQNILLMLDHNMARIRVLFRASNMELVSKLHKLVVEHKLTKVKDSHMTLLVQSGQGIGRKVVAVNKVALDFETNYNKDFKSVHEVIDSRLNKENDKGVVLLYGKPGTGKTTYIRHLISSVNKNVIFIPPQLAKSITHPDVLRILMDSPNSVLVIEDAEELIMDRGINKESPVSALLNLTDGLLSDCLNIQVVCSFNTDLSRVDKALTRKGRLIASYPNERIQRMIYSQTKRFDYE